jgi:hypothetical protein
VLSSEPAHDRGAPSRASAFAAAVAGPLLVLVAVVVVMHEVLFEGLLPPKNTDVLVQFLPNHCLLGRTLQAGEVPGWNPYVMGGVPFAADPQSGWMYLPAMVLNFLLPCTVAIRYVIVGHVALAGLGLYAFARSEGLARAAAATSGVVVALLVAGSNVAVSLPFAGTLGWTAALLALASRFYRSEGTVLRALWLVLAALAWGQLAAVHLSQGLVMGSAALLAYSAAWVTDELRRGRGALVVLAPPLVLAVAFVGVNLAYFLPRLAYLPRSTLGIGFTRLQELAAELQDRRVPRFGVAKALQPTFPLRLALSPGGYAGAGALLLSFGGFFTKRHRPLTIAFLVYAIAFCVVGMRAVAEAIGPTVTSLPFGEFYQHNPGRFAYAVPFAVAVLAGTGVQAWIDATSLRMRIAMVVPPLLLWGALPPLMGAEASALALPAIGLGAAAAVLLLALWRPAAAALVPLVLAVELSVNAFDGRNERLPFRTGIERGRTWWPLEPLPAPEVDVAAYARGGVIAKLVSARGGRLMTLGRGQLPKFRPVVARVEEVQGYNPAQLRHYWTLTRALYPEPLRYSQAYFKSAPPRLVDLYAVAWVAAPPFLGEPPGTGPAIGQEQGLWLFPVERPQPRATLVGRWTVARDGDEALEIVSGAGFHSAESAVLLERPGAQRGRGPTGRARYRASGTQEAVVEVRARRPALLLVRNTFDLNWNATINDRPVEVLQTDYALQGISVPRGRHTVRLLYRDPSIGRGVIGSVLSIAVLLAVGVVARARRSPRNEP